MEISNSETDSNKQMLDAFHFRYLHLLKLDDIFIESLSFVVYNRNDYNLFIFLICEKFYRISQTYFLVKKPKK